MTRRRLTLLLLLFFLALAVPTSILVAQAYSQLKWEAFHQHQQLARELTLRIDSGFNELIQREENRPISDYEFLNVTGGDGSAFLQRSPLSEFPIQSEFPGLLGYFQVDASGQLRTPVMPEGNATNYGISLSDLNQRKQLVARIRGILDQNRLSKKSSDVAFPLAEETVSLDESEHHSIPQKKGLNTSIDRSNQGQAFFDELTLRKSAPAKRVLSNQVKDLNLEDSFEVATSVPPKQSREKVKKQEDMKRVRKEKVNLPQARSQTDVDEVATQEPSLDQQNIRIETFVSEVEPMEFAKLDSGHFVMFRRVWHKEERYVQGILISQNDFIDQLIAPAFRESGLSTMSQLIVAYQGEILKQFVPRYNRLYQPSSTQKTDELLHQSRLVTPFSDIELIYTLARLPIGAGGKIIIWSAVVLAFVLIGGCLMLYRLGLRQLDLARQQQDFVSAVSHELKTPLTSIRMYGEMLREGWAVKEKRKSYYDFIFYEAERLTRLINNVLQLARLSHNEQNANLSPLTVKQVLAELKPRIISQLEPSGFELSVLADETADEAKINIDIDSFLQIFINLVDNALKFSVAAKVKKIDLCYKKLNDSTIQFSVRDYGPGIASDQLKKIFQLFYRSENELTRETVGTGIGLALVQQLATAMNAEVDVINCQPGVEFTIRFPVY